MPKVCVYPAVPTTGHCAGLAVLFVVYAPVQSSRWCSIRVKYAADLAETVIGEEQKSLSLMMGPPTEPPNCCC